MNSGSHCLGGAEASQQPGPRSRLWRRQTPPKALLEEKQFEEIAGLDVSICALELAADRLKLDRLPAKQRERIQLIQGSLTYRTSGCRASMQPQSSRSSNTSIRPASPLSSASCSSSPGRGRSS